MVNVFPNHRRLCLYTHYRLIHTTETKIDSENRPGQSLIQRRALS